MGGCPGEWDGCGSKVSVGLRPRAQRGWGVGCIDGCGRVFSVGSGFERVSCADSGSFEAGPGVGDGDPFSGGDRAFVVAVFGLVDFSWEEPFCFEPCLAGGGGRDFLEGAFAHGDGGFVELDGGADLAASLDELGEFHLGGGDVAGDHWGGGVFGLVVGEPGAGGGAGDAGLEGALATSGVEEVG